MDFILDESMPNEAFNACGCVSRVAGKEHSTGGPPMVDRVGQQLGNYRLLRLLGQGGQASVYLGPRIAQRGAKK